MSAASITYNKSLALWHIDAPASTPVSLLKDQLQSHGFICAEDMSGKLYVLAANIPEDELPTKESELKTILSNYGKQ